MTVPLLLTTIIGELLLLGKVAVTGLGRILLGCTCWVIILTPRKGERSLLKYRHEKLLSEMLSQTKPEWARSPTRLLFWAHVFLMLKKKILLLFGLGLFLLSFCFANKKSSLSFNLSGACFNSYLLPLKRRIPFHQWYVVTIFNLFWSMMQYTECFPGNNRLQPISNWFIYNEPSKSGMILHQFSLNSNAS